MKQYCRYCTHLVTGNGIYCGARNITMRESTAKSVNHCEDFDFNEIDAFGETSGYKPRRSRKTNGADNAAGSFIIWDYRERKEQK